MARPCLAQACTTRRRRPTAARPAAGDSRPPPPPPRPAMALIQGFSDGPIDVVGDIHGESGQLQALLFRLGYDGNGVHAEGRRLVFVGDLVDRGPDSVGVVRSVRFLVEKGRAQMILGNHELNLLRGECKHGNHWFWGKTEQLCNRSPEARHPIVAPSSPSFQVLLQDDVEREAMLEFFRGQPLALEREGLRVVHAMWHPESAEKIRKFRGDVVVAYDHYTTLLDERLRTDLKDAPKDEREMAIQNEHPVTVLTAGMEVPAKEPYFAGGKMRTLERHRWWESYEGEAGLVVVGHYWRRLTGGGEDLGFEPTGPALFGADDAPAWLGPGGAVMCVDYSAGLRFEERGRGLPEGSIGTALAALRVPEMTLHFADGSPTVNVPAGPRECE
mmetsp:Transcript_91924/g.263286  ORF Transcript_91924/g.263286 Transcript_91924/m.263286 type:complete len:387 (-) Transcript_91924:112-1272(-)